MLNPGPEGVKRYRELMDKWIETVNKGRKEYDDLVYNAHTMLKDYYSYEEMSWMPLRNIMENIAKFKPRFKEIARRQQQAQLQQQMEGKRKATQQKQKNEAWRKMYRT